MNGSNNNVGQVVAREVACANLAARTVNRRLTALSVLALVGVSAILFLFNPSHHQFYPPCLFHDLTGLLCPGCGSLRATHQLLHGHVAAAFQLNPLLVLSLPFLLWVAVRLVAQMANQQSPKLALRPFWIWVLFAVMVVFGVLRNLPFFTWPGQ